MSENQSPITPEIYDQFVRRLFNRSGDPSKDFTHAILGIATEIHEFQNATDELNAIEELGDIWFYLVALSQVIEDHEGVMTGDFDPEEGLMTLLNLAKGTSIKTAISNTVNTLLDDAKRWVGYSKQPKSLPEVFRTCAELFIFVNQSSDYVCNDTNKVLRANMAKLLKRYPGGEFSQYHALVRDLDAERDVLQAAQ